MSPCCCCKWCGKQQQVCCHGTAGSPEAAVPRAAVSGISSSVVEKLDCCWWCCCRVSPSGGRSSSEQGNRLLRICGAKRGTEALLRLQAVAGAAVSSILQRGLRRWQQSSSGGRSGSKGQQGLWYKLRAADTAAARLPPLAARAEAAERPSAVAGYRM